LPDVPLLEDGNYYISVPVFYNGGYAYGPDKSFVW